MNIIWIDLKLLNRANGNVKVWTGTFGILSYPDINDNDVDIYLYLDGDDKFIPAPKYYWKVFQDVQSGQAVAFVGLNDPHADDVTEDEMFCNSVCSNIAGYVF